MAPLLSVRAVEKALQGEFLDSGVLFFDGLEYCFEELLRLFSSISVPALHRDSDDRGITRISARVLDGGPYKGFTSGGLDLHTDSAAAPHPPELLLLFCESPGASGGEFLVADGVAAAMAMRAQDERAYQKLFRLPVAMTGTSEKVTPARVNQNGGIDIRYRTVDPARVQDHAHLQKFNDILRATMTQVPCSGGSGYFLDNTKWLHGRMPYVGHRVAFRAQGRAR
ncbi:MULTISPECIES: TauD/TfdA family dioxygenase [unclassified Streptomyces]|uniref:TauD/TfdA family dioxygenase n=1 Tax=unclassified Streptomyces TaxID=2593676 RepID=UPI0012FF5169|nr:TauD/TfdA family dioxygenase [Streptomyces sp. Root264]